MYLYVFAILFNITFLRNFNPYYCLYFYQYFVPSGTEQVCYCLLQNQRQMIFLYFCKSLAPFIASAYTILAFLLLCFLEQYC